MARRASKMNRGNLNHYYCDEHDTDIRPEETEKLQEHSGCKIIKVYENDRDPGLLKDFKKNNLSADEEEEKESKAEKCYHHIQQHIERFVVDVNDESQTYAVIKNEKWNSIDLINLKSLKAKQWAIVKFNEIDTDVYTDSFFDKVLGKIIAIAQYNDKNREQIYIRVAHTNDSIYYDLANEQHQAVKITKEGVKTVTLSKNDPLFWRGQTTYEQIKPKFTDDYSHLEEICQLLHIVPKDRVLFKVVLVAMLLEKYAMPIPFFDGAAGKLKTTCCYTLKKIIDPAGIRPESNCFAMPKDEEDLILSLYKQYFASFDNIVSINPDQAAVLSRAITSGGNTKRKRYTDTEQTIMNFRRKITANGIAVNIKEPDLLDRIISFDRENIDESNRITDTQFQKKLNEILPHVIGSIFVVLGKTMQIYEKIDVQPKTRLADFEIYAEAISQVLGNAPGTVLDLYYQKRFESAIFSKDQYPIVDIIVDMMFEKSEYENTISKLYEYLVEKARLQNLDINSKFIIFPKAGNHLSAMLKKVMPILEKLGISITIYRYTKSDGRFKKNSAIIRIEKVSPPSPLVTDSCLNQTKFSGDDISNVSPPKNADSRHENHSGGDGGDVSSNLQNQRQIVIRNVEVAKQDLIKTGFEVWSNGTVKCKLCSSRMDIPSAMSHACKKRSKSAMESESL